MMYVYLAKAIKTIQKNDVQLRFKWYETPMFENPENAMKHLNKFMKKHKGYQYSHIIRKSVF